MVEMLSAPWPWYVAGPAIGLFVPLLLLFGGKRFGISANLRHLCAAVSGRCEFFRYDWKKTGLWNLVFAAGVVGGGLIGTTLLADPDPTIDLSASTITALRAIGIQDFKGLVPSELISWSGLLSVPGLIMIVGGGLLVGFGARYAGGCTSGHAISGLADLQLPSLIAVLGFFAGGLLVTHLLLPILLTS